MKFHQIITNCCLGTRRRLAVASYRVARRLDAIRWGSEARRRRPASHFIPNTLPGGTAWQETALVRPRAAMSAMRSRQAGRTRPAGGGGAAGRGAARSGGIPKVEYDVRRLGGGGCRSVWVWCVRGSLTLGRCEQLVKNKLTKAQVRPGCAL